jgi:sugar (pentulose or hexulose) kinase
VCAIVRELAAAVPGPVTALAMAAASGNTLLTDPSGAPVTNIINWMDHRAEEAELGRVALPPAEAIWQTVGWPYTRRFPLAHLAWLKENRPDVYRTAGRYCMNSDWLLFKLTGNWRMDHSTATTFYLQDQASWQYHAPFLAALEIPVAKLSALCPSAVSVGGLTPDALRATGLAPETQVVTGCFDHPAAARAFGILEPGKLMLSCGTSWVGFFPELDRRKIIGAELLCDSFLADKGGPWGAIFSVPYIGRTVDWYIDNVIAPGEADKYGVFNDSAAAAKPGADGPRIDLRDPPRAVEGSRGNISRAVMEGAAALLNERINELRKRGIAFERAVMVGGPAKSPVWPGIVQEITGMDLSIGSRHAGAKGAALLAGMGAGIYRDEQDAYRIAGDRI